MSQTKGGCGKRESWEGKERGKKEERKRDTIIKLQRQLLAGRIYV